MKNLHDRQPAVAGQFYPSNPQELKKQLASFVSPVAHPQSAFGCIVPHAGYMYSGHVAGMTFGSIKIRKKIILVGPNHTGAGAQFSIMSAGTWHTPLGPVAIDSHLADCIIAGSKYLKDDPLAHAKEHSLEVQLPFIQYLEHDVTIIPIAVLSHDPHILKEIGREIAQTVKKEGVESDCLLVASTDMTHYEPQESAQKKDREALAAILELNEDRLVEKIQQFTISMCGWAPTIVVLSCAKALGAKTAKLVRYQTSGDVTGDYESVVGYAGVILL